MGESHDQQQQSDAQLEPDEEEPQASEALQSRRETSERSGPIAWMIQNPVAANLAMLVLIIGGALLMFSRVKREVFPEVTLDAVTVTVPYPGASPDEVEQGAVLAVEEAVRGIDGIKEVRSTAREGTARVTAELMSDAPDSEVLDDVKSEVDRITSFPEDAERPVIALADNQRQVISVVVHGDTTHKRLKQVAEEIRRDLLTRGNITNVEVSGLPEPEISIEVPRQALQTYNLTLPGIANSVRAASIDLPAGGAETPGGEVLLRTTERRKFANEFEDITLISGPRSGTVKLGEVAEIKDQFRNDDRAAFFNGEPAVRVDVFRVGNQGPLEIAETVKTYMEEEGPRFEREGATLETWNDRSEIYDSRISLLVENALLGLVLVLVILGFFLEARLAFWVTLGIPITFLGAFFFMYATGVSINMISLFAFLLALGIVVDDAIVVGEAVYAQKAKGLSAVDAAIAGVKEVGAPVVFAVITTMVAFAPLLAVPGVTGKFFSNIPMVVIPILGLSLLESLFILPAHLAHQGGEWNWTPLVKMREAQQTFSHWVEDMISTYYVPVAKAVVRWRYATLAAALGVLVLTAGLIGGGVVKFVFFPSIESDTASVSVRMPFGTPIERTEEVARHLEKSAEKVLEDKGGLDQVGEGIYTAMGTAGLQGGPGGGGAPETGSHVAKLTVQLVGADARDFGADEFVDAWREQAGRVPGADSIKYSFSIGPSEGAPVSVELIAEDEETLKKAGRDLADQLQNYNGVFDVDDGFKRGKQQIDLNLTDAARSLGIVETQLANQVRAALFGAEALREQRGRDELRVYVRLPEDQRDSIYDIMKLEVFTPQSGALKLRQAAELERGRSYTEIERVGGRRVVEVTADVNPAITTGNEVTRDLQEEVLPELVKKYDGLSYQFGGEQEAQREALAALGLNMLIALLVIFTLMAVAFKSYSQPLLIMFAIPFGIFGAVMGHLLLGYNLSIISMLGIVALSGVVVNDSLVLISAVNDYRRDGLDAFEAVIKGGERRFRPILLTSLTTFFGLMPMILETSVQAKFLIPMALSLGFGVLFVTVIALIIVPAAYMVLEDVKNLLGIEANYKDQAVDLGS